MNAEDFKEGDRVVYVPIHAHGDIGHKDVEHGTVSSINEKNVFVRFDATVERLGWDGTTAQACYPWSLMKEPTK